MFVNLVFIHSWRALTALEDVVLLADSESASAVTDTKGTFIFPSLQPGMQNIMVDPQNLGPGYVTADDMPIKVDVEGGKTKNIEVEVTESSSITGRVVLVPRMEGGNPRGLNNVLVQLKRGDTVKRTLTDRNGKFSFDRLHFGTFELKVYQGRVPESHYLKNSIRDITVGESERKNVEFRALPRKRTIQFIDEGVIGTE